MNEADVNRFEAELRSLRPAQPSVQSAHRLLEHLSPRSIQHAKRVPRREIMNLIRWLIPTAAAGVVVVAWMAVRWTAATTPARPHTTEAASGSPSGSERISNFAGLQADKVEIDRQLVAQFETVAQLPDGQPLRVRCERWMDTIQLRDSSRGLVLERTAPRLEIIPIGFETY